MQSGSNTEGSSESDGDDAAQPDNSDGGSSDKENVNPVGGKTNQASKVRPDPKDPKVPPRAKADRLLLDPKLIDWVVNELKHNNPLTRPFHDILSHANRKKVLYLPSTSPHLASPLAITQVLGETDEWAARHSQSLYEVVSQHDNGAREAKLAALARSTAARMKHTAFTTDEFIVSTSESFSRALEEYGDDIDSELPIDTNKRRKV